MVVRVLAGMLENGERYEFFSMLFLTVSVSQNPSQGLNQV